MKKFLHSGFLLAILFPFSINLFAQTIIAPADELLLPQYIMTGNTTASRLQFVCRLSLNGLIANSTYRYYSSASTSSTITTSNAPGNFFAISNTPTSAGYILGYSSGKSLGGGQMGATPNENEFTSATRFDQFTTDASGSYTGWFAVVPTSNAVFAPGNNVYFYVQINNGAGGTSIVTSYRTTNTMHVVDCGTTSGNPNQATAITGTSNVAAENMIFLYDNIAGTGRPLFGTWTENDAITTNFTTWYGAVEAMNSAWGAIIPNNLPGGVQRIEARNVSNGAILGCPSIDADGIWPGGANTINPAGGTTPLIITLNDAPLQFIASSNSPVCPGSTITFSSTTGSSYAWSGPSSFSSSAATPSIPNASITNDGIYTVQITDANGCTSPATTTVSVNSSLTATVSGGGSICPGDSTLITFTFSGSGPWDFTYSDGSNATTINAYPTATYTFYASSSATYTISSVTSNSCTGTGTGSAVVTSSAPAAPSVTPPSPTIFSYNSITLTASGSGTFNWYATSTGGIPLFTGAAYTPTPALTTTTTFYVDATVSGCTGTRTPVTVTVNPNPVLFDVYNYYTPYSIGTYLNMNINFGGFSGLHAVPGNGNEYYTVTDRGPNLDANNNVHAASNPNAKLFALPNFSPSIVHFITQGDSIVILDVKPIKRPNGTNTSGLILPSNAGGTGEIAYTDTAGTIASPDIWGIDSEGITAGNDNDFWMCEEYATSIWHVDSTGQVINRYTPYANTAGGQPEDLPIDTIFKYRNPNKGFEGLAFAPNGKVYAGIQNMIFFPASAASAIKSNSRLHRIEEIDPATGATRMFGYEHDAVPTAPTYGSTINNGNRYIGDAVAVNDHQFLILEHGTSSTQTYAKVYLIDINAATPITQAFYGGLSFEQLYTAATAQANGITCVTKTLLVDLISCGYDGSLTKEEGIAILNDSTIAIGNDNDFGVISPNADGNIAANGIPTRVYVFHLNAHLDLCRNAHITASSATTFCQGNTLQLNASTGTGLTYQWTLNGNPIAGATLSTYAASATGNYAVEITNATGCLANSNVKAVNVLPAPPAIITAGGPLSFCQGGNVALSVAAGNTYQWMRNSTNISGATNASFTANISGNYSVLVTNSNGCTQTSAVTNVTVNPLPTAFILPNGPLTFCSGGNVTLAGPSGNGFNYQWLLNSTVIAGATNMSYFTSTAGIYNLTVTNANGCSFTSSPSIVTVNPVPTAAFTANGPTAFCQGDSVLLNANTASGYSYQWLMNGNAINNATDSSYNAMTTGTFNLLVTSSGCSDTSASSVITVNALPAVPVISQNGNILSAPAGYTYQWYLNGNPIAGATAQMYMASTSGNYSVEISDVNTCAAQSAPYIFTPTDITPGVFVNVPTATVFPNPFHGSAQLMLSLPSEMNVQIEIYNVLGEKTGVVNAGTLTAGNHSLEMESSAFAAAGTYFIRVTCGETLITKKVLVD
ncbi:MAG: esterase-like activity of phytase family protein [Bacteroidia bacterium]